MISIKKSACISPQHTFGENPFSGEIIIRKGPRYHAIEPDYSRFIPRNQLRRMGKFLRLGVGAGAQIVRENNPDAIIIGTANGGLENSVGFLDQIMKYDEGTLTPTHFVQSTSNSVSGLLSLMTENHGYNATHVHLGLAFETSLLDAILLFEEKEVKNLLTGSVEAISEYNYNIDRHRKLIKKEEISSEKILNSGTPGFAAGEGAAMFLLSEEKNTESAAIIDINTLQSDRYQDVEDFIRKFLTGNYLKSSDIDTLILGMNGDVTTDHFYHGLINNYFTGQEILVFKHLTGEYPTASSFALWLSSLPYVPAQTVYRKGENTGGLTLIYNHYLGIQHGVMLVKKPR